MNLKPGIIALTALLASTIITGQEINIIPRPAELTKATGTFTIKPTTTIVVVNSVDDNTAAFLNNYLKRVYGFQLKTTKIATGNHIRLITLQTLAPGKDGAYNFEIDSKGVTIQGQTASGTFAGMQTLIQLLPVQNPGTKIQNLVLPQLQINDYPRFGYRGMHLDCARHFWSVDFVKQYIDYLALHKFNKFHWHLTDDQGWRIEIKKYPKLTQAGGWRDGTIIGRYPGNGNDGKKYGGFYTQQQVKEIVKYAADRFITVIPEIEMPGHASAAIAAYPELSCFPNEPTIKYFPKQCKWNGDSSGKKVQQTWGVFDDVFCAGKESTFEFIQNVMEEVLTLFPSKYIHVGGDECPKENWIRCDQCQSRIKQNKLKDEHELQSYFIQRMEKYLNSKGRILIGWDEILEGGLAPNAVVMSWRGEQGGIDAAKQNHDVIMTPGNPVYFDHSQSENEDSVTIGGYNPLEKVYAYEPIPKGLTEVQGKHILGAQANMWTEYMANTRKVEYMLFPRIAALSEVLWSSKDDRDFSDFEKRLVVQFKRYDQWKVNYSKAYFELKTSVSETEDHKGVSWNFVPGNNSDAQYKLSWMYRAVETDTIPVYSPTDPGKVLKYTILKPGDSALMNIALPGGTKNFKVTREGKYTLSAFRLMDFGSDRVPEKTPFTTLVQSFHINKATGKKISLATPASNSYPGDGAFTLVNGIINEKGMARSKQFLGFSGTNCEAVIDLGAIQEISFVVVNCLRRESSWIWQPQSAEVFGSGDGEKWYSLKLTDDFTDKKDGTGKGIMMMPFRKTFARYVKVVVTNWGDIPAGNPGAGNKAWLFVDEIEVE